MNEAEQVAAYAEADFDEGHTLLFSEAMSRLPKRMPMKRILDLGCGPGDFSRRLAKAFPDAEIVGVDGAANMLKRAADESEKDGLRISWVQALLHEFADPDGFDLVFSNSLLHHLHHPEQLWASVKSLTRNDGWVHISDLRRPASRTQAEWMVKTYSADEPEVLRRDFFHSLCAAFTPEEIAEQCKTAALDELTVEPFGDRHVLVFGRMDRTS